MMGDIEDRLRSHAQAFDGLLSLIPAKYYYGEDNSDQWQRKKQTKEQAREAKRAKLDPESGKTAKDVMDENARKRKRDDDAGSESGEADAEELGSEMPKEGLNRGDSRPKKQKQPDDKEQSENGPGKKAEDAETRKKLKEEKKTQKKNAQKEKKKEKEAARKERIHEEKNKNVEGEPHSRETTPDNKKSDERQASKTEAEDDNGSDEDDAEGISLKFNPEEQPSSNSSTPNSPGFDTSNGQSGSSSISSIVPPTATDADKTAEQKTPKPTPEELKQRLQKRLDELRAARHADGFNGKPARNRQELIEARRQKAEQRKTHKKLVRQKAKEEEQRVNDEAMARRFSPGGSGSLLASPRSPADSVGSPTSYSFGRMVFTDGGQTDPNLSSLRDQPKSQGPQDAATALKAVEGKKARLAGLDEEKRTDLEEKDLWLNAKKRAHGERVRDNTSLLKKALKRKDSAKKKSEREWKDRLETVNKGKEARQAKREENLRSRREEKGSKGKKGGSKKKARPGFEGSFKTRVGGKK